MRVHFIAIGGAVMHNLAIVLHKKGYKVTGSDDEIFEPSKSHLGKYGLLPPDSNWHPEIISTDIDLVILGMHARIDNPELIRANEIGLKVISFPELLYDLTKNKKRIVVAGSHGKTTITAMIMHVFNITGLKFDYVVGSGVEGFETMAGLSDESGIAVFEGDEYLSSALDRRPKFLLYRPDIAIINGIAWDHKNVFPTFEKYAEQFRLFAGSIEKGGTLIYFDGDEEVKEIALGTGPEIRKIPYKIHGHFQNKEGFFAATHNRTVAVSIFGEHNMQNLSAAKEACLAVGVPEDDFYSAIKSFRGTYRRLQLMGESDKGTLYFDFAHSPSKVKATVDAVVSRYTGRKIIACLELHTYSSLSMDFIPLYRGTLDKASVAVVYFNPHTISLKKLHPITREEVLSAIGGDNLLVFDNSEELFRHVSSLQYANPVFLFMSSGNFDGLDMSKLI